MSFLKRLALALSLLAAFVPPAGAAEVFRSQATALSTGRPRVARAAPGGGGVAAGEVLTSGVAAAFTIHPLTNPSLFNGDSGFTIVVPAGAKRLDIRITTSPNVDVELFVRAGQDVVFGSDNSTVLSDNVAEGASGAIVLGITTCSVPALNTTGTTYFIAPYLFTTGTAVTGAITATIDAPGAPACGSAASSFLPAVTGPTLFPSSVLGDAVTVPAGATQVQINVTTATPNATVLLYARFGQDVGLSGTSVVADYMATSPGGNQSITINASSSPPLRPGVYYVALGLLTTGIDVSGTITIAVSTGAPPGAPPVISAAVNAGSFAGGGLPNGAVAQGAIFTLFGQGAGPASSPSLSFPLQTTLAGVSIKVTQGTTSVNAIPLFVSPTQINAIMPSNVPTGQAQITVTFNGLTSSPLNVQVAGANFGMFTADQSGSGPGIFTNFNSQTDQPINSPNQPAKPNQFVTAWGTGLGAIAAADNQPPPVGSLAVKVEITVGGQAVSNTTYFGRAPGFAGLDQMVFQVPANAPQGCFVPVVIRVNGLTGNVTTMAVDPQGNACSDPTNPVSRFAVTGGKVGSVELLRLRANLQLNANSPSLTPVTLDLGSGVFVQAAPNPFAFSPLSSLPPPGSCNAFSGAGLNVAGFLAGQLPTLLPASGQTLDAGSALSVTGAKGTAPVARSSAGATYDAVIGGSIPVPGGPNLPLLLDPGSFTVTGPGGADVGPFTLNITVPGAINWTNEAQLTIVQRTLGITPTWTGGDPSSQGIVILGGNLDTRAQVGGVFLCSASLGAGSFTVPPSILSTVPPTNFAQRSQTIGFLFLGVLPTSNLPTFTATGLDAGYGLFGQFVGTSAVYQ